MIDKGYTMEDLEELLDSIPYAVCLKDENGRYKYVNKQFSYDTGYSKENIISKSDKDIGADYMYEESDLYVKRAEKNLNLDIGHSDNAKKTYFKVLKTLLNKRKNLMGVIAKEVGSIKNIHLATIENLMSITDSNEEKKHTQSDNKILHSLKNIMKCDDIALYIFDEYSESMNLYIHEGDSYEKYLPQFTKEAYTALKSKFNHKNMLKSSGQEVEYFYPIKIRNILSGLILCNYKHGEPKYIDTETIKEVCILLGVIIENKRLSRNLNEQLKEKDDIQKKLEIAIETAIDIYAIVERVEDHYKWLCLNRTFEKIIGISFENMGENSPLEYVHPDDKEYVKSILHNNIKEYRNLICRVICNDGKYRTMNINWSNISDNIFVVTGRDISNERKLLKDKENLQHAVEFESLKTEFFANLSHEFKTPLNIILSTVQVILSNMENDIADFGYKKLEKYLKGIQQNSFRLLKLANNMIDITKIDGGFYELDIDNYNIVEVIENIVHSVTLYMKNNKRKITFDTMEEEIITACDPEKIERIILNLLSNSMKFTSEEGCIDVDMDITNDCRNVIIKVRNDGPAINREDAEKIFNRFTQSENLLTRSVEGSGIGLALVKSLVELHKGRIYVNTEFENGTEFCIELPIRKIMNSKISHVSNKKLNSKVERFTIEFSDIYDLN
ncbi:ATP-binding protein [uncultured Clostridium sp.]|uniref:ATP-binding protein n=1 Tax=uncultured Clostridium sp. TaxID=59620 RepID=UPI0025F76D66|nr:ATP-binding protein [uncultured Clostridium sp.]